MDFEWVAIALGDVAWISMAFLLGFLVRLINLPPLVGFLATGFVLNYLGFGSGEMLQKLADPMLPSAHFINCKSVGCSHRSGL